MCSSRVCAQERGPLKLPWAGCVSNDAVNPSAHKTANVSFLTPARKGEGDAVPSAVNSGKAMLHSLLIPGWGQLDNGRRKKAAFFFAAEMFFIGGYIYENSLARKSGLSARERDAYRTDRNNFVIYWFLTKILDITDAYVDAQLADFNVRDITPDELKKKGVGE